MFLRSVKGVSQCALSADAVVQTKEESNGEKKRSEKAIIPGNE